MNAVQKLEATGFHTDLCETLHGFAVNTSAHFLSLGMRQDIVQSLVGDTAEYFAGQYLQAQSGINFSCFVPERESKLYLTKMKYLGSIEKLKAQFGDRLPAIVYKTLAFVGTREDPHTEVRIPDIASSLFTLTGADWISADTVLHALPKCSKLNLHTLSLINEATGSVIMHGCACNHLIPAMGDYFIRCFMKLDGAIVVEETESLLRHLLGDMVLLKLGMPRIIGISDRAERTQREWVSGRTFLRQLAPGVKHTLPVPVTEEVSV